MKTRENSFEKHWALICVLLFLFRILQWSMSDLWYDEVLTLVLYCFRCDSLGDVFRDYAIANNHILMSAVYWLWLRVINFNLLEVLLRLPSILLGGGTVLLACLHWRKFIGKKLAFCAAVMLATSPVFCAFAYQMRGYCLSMFLSALAVSGMLETVWRGGRRGQMLLCCSAFLQPLVMPSALMMCAVPALWLFWYRLHSGARFWQAVKTALPVTLSAVCGASYYATLLPQLQHAAVDAGGWESSWAVAGSVALGLMLHLGFFALALAVSFCRSMQRCFRSRRKDGAAVLLLAVIVTAIVPLVMRPGGHAPFPRVFLLLLPFVTFAACWSCRNFMVVRRLSPLHLALALMAFALVLERTTTALTAAEIQEARMPQNLLMQYYRGSDDCSHAVGIICAEADVAKSTVLVNAYDERAFCFYWERAGLLPEVFAENRVQPGFMNETPALKQKRLIVVARNESEAKDMFAKAGRFAGMIVLGETAGRIVYGEELK